MKLAHQGKSATWSKGENKGPLASCNLLHLTDLYQRYYVAVLPEGGIVNTPDETRHETDERCSMNMIAEQDIDSVVARLGSTEELSMDRLFEKMDGEQHPVVDYLYEVEGDDLNQDERDMMINFSIIGWFIISEILGCSGKVTDTFLGSQLERNADLLEEREVELGDFEDALISVLPEYSGQPVLMGFLANLVIDRPEEYTGDIRNEMIPVIIMHIKTVMDCLILGDESRVEEAADTPE